MSARSSLPPSAARLQLRSCRGVATQAAVALDEAHAVPLSTISSQSPVTVPDETQAALLQCRLEPVPGPAGTQWWLRNLGSTLRCTVNALVLDVGDALPLQDGDTIELGLLQIGFQAQPSRPAAAPPPAIDAAFRLTDLGQLAAPVHRQMLPPATMADPFDGIVDAFHARVAGPLGAPSLPATSAAPVEPAEPAPADAAASALSDTDGVMDGLHRQYLRLMQNPNDPQMAGRWNAPAVPSGPRAPSFDELTRQAQSRDLYDILGHTGAIDPILERLDTLSDRDILQPPETVDVLRLFAPVHRPASEEALPGVTRRDHHRITADSAMHLQAGVATPAPSPDPAPAPSPNRRP